MLSLSSAEVTRRVEQAFRQTTRKWVPGKDGDPFALEKAHREFLSSLIKPEHGVVLITEALAEVVGIPAGPHDVWFVNHGAVQRVFYDENSGEFGVAWGPDETGTHIDIAARTSDPIDAFLA